MIKVGCSLEFPGAGDSLDQRINLNNEGRPFLSICIYWREL